MCIKSSFFGTIVKREREQNNLAEGTCSRMERNDLKKVGMCPALVTVYSKFVLGHISPTLNLLTFKAF